MSQELSHVERGKVVIQDVTVKRHIFPRDSFVFILVCSTERNPQKFVFLRWLNYSNGRKCSASNYHPTRTLQRPRFPTPEVLGTGQARTCWQKHLFIYVFIALETMWVISKYLWYWFSHSLTSLREQALYDFNTLYLGHETFAPCFMRSSSVSWLIVYGNLNKICILLLCENCISLNYVELVHNSFQV